MPSTHKQAGRGTGPTRAIARYALAWIVLGGALAALALVLLDRPDRPRPLPALRAEPLSDAVRGADCRLRHVRSGAALRPPVDGPSGTPAPSGFYETSPSLRRLTAALRRGVIVVYYRRGLAGRRLDELRALQSLAPGATIVAPDTSGMRYAVAVTAYHRLLGCRRVSDRAIDAMRLFRGRYIATGPDR